MKLSASLPLLIFISLLFLLAVGLNLNPREIPSPLVGRPMPSFDLPSLADHKQRVSSSNIVGEFSLINVWASWCGQCRREHSLLMAIAEENALPIYGINYKDVPEKARQILHRTGNPYIDIGVDQDGQVGLEYGVYGVPETYLVDERGHIVFKHVGALSKEIYEQQILSRLQEKTNAG